MKLNSLELELPYPPSINHYYDQSNGRKFLNIKVKNYREEVLYRFKSKVSIRFGDTPVSVMIYIYPPDKRRRDADNPIKGIFDILQILGVFNDDCQIVHYCVEKRECSPKGNISIVISEHNNAVTDKKYKNYHYALKD